MLEIVPMFNRVLVERVPEKESTAGGLFIPDSARERPQEAVVIAVGPGRVTDYGIEIPTFVKVDDHVLIPRYAGADVVLEGRELLLVNEDEIQGIIRVTTAGQSDPLEN